MKVKVDGNELVIRVPLNKKPPVSGSGKSRIAYSSGGFSKSGVTYQGKGDEFSINLNVILPLEEPGKGGKSKKNNDDED